MEHFSLEGVWWLPEAPSRRIPGTLDFDASGLELVLYDQLHEFVMQTGQALGVVEPEWTVTPFVHGRTRDGRDVTLLDVGGVSLAGPFTDVRETYRAKLGLVGHHVTVDAFSEAWCEFDFLDVWADPPSLRMAGDGETADPIATASRELARAKVDSDVIVLQSGVRGTSGDASIHLDRWTAFAIECHSPTSVDLLRQTRVRPLHDLLTLTLGRPVRLTTLLLRPAGADPRKGLGEAYYEAVQPEMTGGASLGSVLSYSAPTLVTGRTPPLPLDELMSEWFRLRTELEEAIVLLLGPFYASFMYGEHRFASTFQSAEALHRARFQGRELDKAGHRKRVAAVISAARDAGLDETTVAWAERLLTPRNDKPLSQMVDEVVRSTGAIGDAVHHAAPDFGDTIAAARTGVFHGGARGQLDSAALHWYGEILRWVIRARLLMEMGDVRDEIVRRVLEKAAFRFALDKIRDDETRSESEADRNL